MTFRIQFCRSKISFNTQLFGQDFFDVDWNSQ